MTYEEAIEWLKGNRTMGNNVTCDPLSTWLGRIAEADAAMLQQAYWVVRAHKEKLI